MAKKRRLPLAFMSYVHFDDEHDDGHLTKFRERLSHEVRAQTSKEFPIFQDRNDLQWGQNWGRRIKDSIDAATFLIPIITPSFFKSPYCRDELKQFLAREEKLKRDDLILPVYYITTSSLEEKSKRARNKLAQEIARHQRADWRKLRFTRFNSPRMRKAVAELAEQISKALKRRPSSLKRVVNPSAPEQEARPLPSRTTTVRQPTRARADSSSQASKAVESNVRPSALAEPRAIIVDSSQQGDFLTITEAIAAAKSGARILVRPGVYREGLIIDKPLVIKGDGERDKVVVQATGQSTVLFRTKAGQISNLSLRQMGGGDCYCVDIAQGRLELEACDITSQSLACVFIHGNAAPQLRRNRIHDGNSSGVFISNGQGTLEDNDIFGHTLSGVEISTGSNPTLLRNRIHDGKQAGVLIHENGQGTLEENDIFGNTFAGVEITSGGNPTLRCNRIHDGKESGVFIDGNGQGTLEENDIFGNAYSGITIKAEGNPAVRHNRINRNAGYAINIIDTGGGIIEGNDLRSNVMGAWPLFESEPHVTRARNLE